jgi:hypothetical protein
MKISEWLDKKEKEGADVLNIELPQDLSHDEDLDETLYFKELRPCSIICQGNHPYSTVRRFEHWYYASGQDKKAGVHASGMNWRLFKRDRDIALKTAGSHIE